jgi:hypothetical protein
LSILLSIVLGAVITVVFPPHTMSELDFRERQGAIERGNCSNNHNTGYNYDWNTRKTKPVTTVTFNSFREGAICTRAIICQNITSHSFGIPSIMLYNLIP